MSNDDSFVATPEWDPIAQPDFDSSPGALELDAEIAATMLQLRTGLESLLAIGDRGDLMALGPKRLAGAIRAFEEHRNALAAVDAVLIEAAQEERLQSHLASPNLPNALSKLLKIAPATAYARVRQSEQIQPRNGFSAGEMECRHPIVLDAVRAGALSVDQHATISRALHKLATNPKVDDEQVRQAESTLVDLAASLTPDELKQAARVIDDCLLPDGLIPNEEITRARRGLNLGPVRTDGTHKLTGTLTPELHAKLSAMLSPLAAPRPSDENGPDPRSAAQRNHDALEQVADRILGSDALPHTGGAKTTIHVTITLEQLRQRLAELRRHDAYLAGDKGETDPASRGEGCGWLADTPTGAGLDGADTSDGTDQWIPFGWNKGQWNRTGWFTNRAAATTTFGSPLSIRELVRIAEQAEIIPTFLNDTGGVMAYGRLRRYASPGQVKALIGRDKGCSFPSCTAPPEWCESHHIIEWWRGGKTELANLTLLCGYHHRDFLRCGWIVEIRGGVPVWIPPQWIDEERRPQVNTRIGGLDSQLDLSLFRSDSDPGGGGRAGPGGDGRAGPNHTARPDAPPDGARRDFESASDFASTEQLDPLDDLIALLDLHIPTTHRDDFHRGLADLLDQHGAELPDRGLDTSDLPGAAGAQAR